MIPTSDLLAQGDPMPKLRHHRFLLIVHPGGIPKKMESILSLIESGVTGLTLTLKSEDLTAFAKNLIESAKEELLPLLKKAEKEDFMSKEDVLKLFGICGTTLWNWEKKGYLVPIKPEGSRKVIYLRSDIDQLLQKRGL